MTGPSTGPDVGPKSGPNAGLESGLDVGPSLVPPSILRLVRVLRVHQIDQMALSSATQLRPLA
jgi:hypothetical protein